MQRVQLKQETPAQVDERCWGCDICFSVCCCAGVQHVCMITLRLTEGWTEELCATITIIYHHLSISVKITRDRSSKGFSYHIKGGKCCSNCGWYLGIFRYYNCIYLLTFTTPFLVVHPQPADISPWLLGAGCGKCRYGVPADLHRPTQGVSVDPGVVVSKGGSIWDGTESNNRGLVDDIFSNNWCLKFHFEA